MSTNETVSCKGGNRFVARSLGGFYFFTGGTDDDTYTGARLPTGASAWVAISDRNDKDHIREVDARSVLDRLLAVPIATWNWKSQPASIRHMGPMAQDFRAAFGLGEIETGISTVDADGVAFAAIQGLNAKVEALMRSKNERIAALEQRVRALEALFDDSSALRAARAAVLRDAATATAKSR